MKLPIGAGFVAAPNDGVLPPKLNTFNTVPSREKSVTAFGFSRNGSVQGLAKILEQTTSSLV